MRGAERELVSAKKSPLRLLRFLSLGLIIKVEKRWYSLQASHLYYVPATLTSIPKGRQELAPEGAPWAEWRARVGLEWRIEFTINSLS